MVMIKMLHYVVFLNKIMIEGYLVFYFTKPLQFILVPVSSIFM